MFSLNREAFRLLGFLWILNFLWMLFQFGVVLASRFESFRSAFGDGLTLPLKEVFRFVYFGFAQVLCYSVVTVLLWVWVMPLKRVIQDPCLFKRSLYRIWFSFWLCLYALALWQFPTSRFNWLVQTPFQATVLFSATALWFIRENWSLILIWFRALIRYWKTAVFVCLVLILVSLGGKLFENLRVKKAESSSLPNVILIGLDDVRPDELSSMPALSKFLSESTHFQEVVTPEARTFVAWTSLLTGLYPKATGLRFDLQSVATYTPPSSLAQILKENGYTTFYSTDDDQYARVTKAYGFDHELVGIMDADDYAIADWNDFPLIDLISQTFVGRILFPDTYNNRAAAYDYEPKNYNRDLLSALDQIRNRPLFLAVHFNLSHQPFYWSQHGVPQKYRPGRDLYSLLYYQASQDMDRQFSEFLEGLKTRGLLKNSLVIVFSDHGESLGLKGERTVKWADYVKGPKSDPDSIDALNLYSSVPRSKFDSIYGHGTDVFSRHQWNTVLGIKWYSHRQYEGTIQQRVSLVDVKSTILDLLKIPLPKNDPSRQIPSQYVGRSLKSMVLFGKTFPNERFFFTDSGFNPMANEDLGKINMDDAQISLELFVISKDEGRLMIRSSEIPKAIDQMQHAVIDGNWILGAYPGRTRSQHLILLDMNSGQWTDDLCSGLPLVSRSPIDKMFAQMKNFYGDELTWTQLCPALQEKG